LKTLILYDLYAAAYALATGVELVRVMPDTWASFVFDDTTAQASRALGEWRVGTALVPVRAYACALRQLRRSIKNTPRDGATQGDDHHYDAQLG
jgi:hypothetical protein